MRDRSPELGQPWALGVLQDEGIEWGSAGVAGVAGDGVEGRKWLGGIAGGGGMRGMV
jgi:hypothetical protein